MSIQKNMRDGSHGLRSWIGMGQFVQDIPKCKSRVRKLALASSRQNKSLFLQYLRIIDNEEQVSECIHLLS